MRKWTLRIVVGLALAGLVVVAFLPEAQAVDLGTVVRGPLAVAVEEDGKTRIRERYTVSAPLTGRLLRVTLQAGDSVRAGTTTLATIEPVDPTLLNARERAVAEARAAAAEVQLSRAGPELERATAALAHAERELERVLALPEPQRTSRQLDAARLDCQLRGEELRSARFAAEIAAFERDVAEAALLHSLPESDGEPGVRLRIRSPIDGLVLRRYQESAAVIQAGTPLLEVGDPADLEVEVDVLSRDAVRIEPGARVAIVHWGGGEALQGRVRRVEPAAFTKVSALGVEEQRVNVLVDLLDAPDRRATLGDAFRVEAQIVIWAAEDVLKVPIGAAFRVGEQWAVFVVENGVAALRTVELGHSNGHEAEVLAGLEEGEQVVLHPADALEDGTYVERRAGR